jgi:hypothetical protein
MTRERRALAAFLGLAMLATTLAVLVRPHSAGRRQAAPLVRTATRVPDAATVADRLVRARSAARTAAARARRAELAGRVDRIRSSRCPSVPLYPLARRVPQRRDGLLLRAVNGIRAVPVVNGMERFSLGHAAWLGGDGVPVVFQFYRHRMRPVGFAEMSAGERRGIGVRPVGTVDSPPLLYVQRTGAALVQALRGGRVQLTLFCGPVDL